MSIQKGINGRKLYYRINNQWVDTNPDVGNYALISAISADKFRSYWGVRIFPMKTTSTYGELNNPDGLGREWLTDLDPATVTTKISPSWHQGTKNLIGVLGARGTKTILTVGEPFETYTSAEWNEMMADISDVQDDLLMVNGQNEINHVRGDTMPLPSDWAQIATDHQIILWNRMATLNTTRVNQGKAPILVGSPNLWSGDFDVHHADLATLAPMVKNYCNVACFHLYPRGVHPDFNLDTDSRGPNTPFISEYRKSSNYGATKKLWCTEAGYFDAVNYVGNSVTVLADTKAKYLPKQWLEYASRDIPVSYFEFLDDVDPGDTDREASLGMINTPQIAASSWQAKPSYTAIRTMLARKGGSTGTVPCNITTSSAVKTKAVTDSTGTMLYAWRTDDIEDNKQAITLSPATIALTVESPNTPLTTVNVGRGVTEIRI